MSKHDQDTSAELDREAIAKDFSEAVNMAPSELEEWLKTDESKAVGWKTDGSKESVGHDSGRKIIAIKRKKKSDFADADIEHMRKVVGYVHRHLAQGGPADDAEHSRWRYSLMNWGHDPLKK